MTNSCNHSEDKVRSAKPIIEWLLRTTATATALLLLVPTNWAQITAVTVDQAPPIPGAGHDYIHFLNEIVNPSSGSVSIRIQAPVPTGRSLTLPFAFGYDSNAAHHLSFLFSTPGPWADNAGYLSQGGWSYELPTLQLSIQPSVAGLFNTGGGGNNITECYIYSNYIFDDMNGTPHEPRLAISPFSNICGSSPYWPETVLTDGDGTVSATTAASNNNGVNQPPPSPVTVTTADGTVYYFANTNPHIAGIDTDRDDTKEPYTVTVSGPNTYMPTYVEDRNGNKVTFIDSGAGKISITDDIGRTILSTSGFGLTGDSVSVEGLNIPYTTTWTTEPYSFSMGIESIASSQIATLATEDPTQEPPTCGTGSNTSVVNTKTLTGSQPELTSLALPNGQSYSFQYDPVYGELSKIVYPTGAYVRYEWGLTSSYAATYLWPPTTFEGSPVITPMGATCEALLPSVVVLHRFVSFDGVHEVQQQDFSYSTTFGDTSAPGGSAGPYQAWRAKQTIVTTHDLLRGTSYTKTYNYTAEIVPGTPAPYSPESYTGVFNTLPGETNVQTTGWNGSLISYVNETYSGPYLPPTDKKTTLTINSGSTGMTSEVQTSYASGTLPLWPISDVYTYDFGAIGAVTTASGPFGSLPQATASGSQLTHTHYDYATFATSPVGGAIVDRPKDVIVYNGGGTRVAETDYAYDGAPLASVAATAHDDTAFPATYLTRGNATTITLQCFIGSNSCTNGTTNYTSAVTSYTYFNTGQPASMKDANLNLTSYLYTDNFSPSSSNPATNTNAYLTQITYPATNGTSHIENFSYYYALGEPFVVKDENNQPTQYTYGDPWGRLTQTSYPDGGGTSVTYNDAIPSITTTKLLNASGTPSPAVNVSTMDGVGHVIKTQLMNDQPVADTVVYTYDGEGLLLTESNPYRSSSNGSSTYYYDALGRKVDDVEQDGTALQWCYNSVASYPGLTIFCSSSRLGSVSAGSWIDSTDEVGNHSQRTSDASNRLTEVMEPNGSAQAASMETDYSYDALNDLTAVTQWGGSNGSTGARSRSFTYDSLSRLVASRNPEAASSGTPPSLTCAGATGSTWTMCYSYDSNGNLTSKTDNRSITTSYSYDQLNRVTSKSYSSNSNGTPLSCYQYDTASNGNGRLGNEWTLSPSKASCPTATPFLTKRTILAYDPMGRLSGEQQYTPASQAGGTFYAPAYTYDLAGNLLTSTDGTTPSPTTPSAKITFTSMYDSAEHLSSLTSNWVDPTHPSTLFSVPSLTSSPPCTNSDTAPYTAFGALANATYGNGLTVNRAYDVRLRHTCEIDVGGNTAATSGTATVTITGAEQTKQ